MIYRSGTTTAITPNPVTVRIQQQLINANARIAEIQSMNFFHSGAAWNLFMPKGEDRSGFTELQINNAALEAIRLRIKVCKKSCAENNSEDDNEIRSWHFVVDRANANTDDDEISEYQRNRFRYMCQYIMIALQYALEKMGLNGKEKKTWAQCCDEAVKRMNDVGITYIKTGRTVQNWHKYLRDSGNTFPHPHPQKAAGQKPLPLFLAENPTVKMAFIQYADDLAKRGELKSERMMSYVNDTLVPNALKEHNEHKNQQSDNDPPLSREDYLKTFGLLRGRKAVVVHTDTILKLVPC